jgi:hypothetical protein
MSLGVTAELASIELLNLVEETVELVNGLLNVVPRLIKVASVRNRQLDLLRLHLAGNFLIGLVHSEELFMGLLQAFKLVGGVDEDAISLIRVHMDVDIGGGDGLHGVGGTIIEQVGDGHGEIFLTDVEV